MSPRPVVEPEVTPSANDRGTTHSHPAFGLARATRVSGVASLYGSEFLHNGYIQLTISRSVLNRELSTDWHYERDEVVRVNFSEAQWVAFITRMNVGSGTPCTLDMVGKGGFLPAIPEPRDVHAEFKRERDERLQDAQRLIGEAEGMVRGLKLPKAEKERLHGVLRQAAMQLGVNLDFVAQQFGRHMESRVERARTEIAAWIDAAITRAGIALLRGQKPPLLLDGSERGSDEQSGGDHGP